MVVIIPFVHILVIAALAFQLYRRQTRHRQIFWPALMLKLLAGGCLGLLYTHYYAVADTFGYFKDALTAGDLARRDLSSYLAMFLYDGPPADLPLVMTEPRAFFFTRVVSVFGLLTNGNYWAIGFYFSFFSFLGTWSLVQVISRNIPKASRAAIIAFLFLPSAVFWTSGVLKESLAMASLFFLTALFLKAWFREKVSWWEVAVGVIGFWLLWNLKYYYAGVFMAVVCTTLLYRILSYKRAPSSAFPEVLGWALTLLVPAVLVTLLHPNFNIDRLLSVVVENNAAYHALSRPDNVVHFYQLEASPQSIAANTPWALFSGLFRPFLWEASSALHLIAALENTVLFVLFLTCLSRINPVGSSPHRLLVLSVVVYVVVLAVFLTLSAPNFGTLSRYRVGYISFFTFIILCDNHLLATLKGHASDLLTSSKVSNFEA